MKRNTIRVAHLYDGVDLDRVMILSFVVIISRLYYYVDTHDRGKPKSLCRSGM